METQKYKPTNNWGSILPVQNQHTAKYSYQFFKKKKTQIN